MDGFNDIQSEGAQSHSRSAEMSLAMACLGGRRRWEGDVRGLFGIIRRRFSIHSDGVMRDGAFCFSETLSFDDGETQQREWRLVEAENGLRVEGPDVEQIEPAQLASKNALDLVYKIKLGTLRFRYRDLFRLRDNGFVENVGHVSFAGFRVMTVTASSPEGGLHPA